MALQTRGKFIALFKSADSLKRIRYTFIHRQRDDHLWYHLLIRIGNHSHTYIHTKLHSRHVFFLWFCFENENRKVTDALWKHCGLKM